MTGALAAIRKFSRPYVFGMIHLPALPGSPLNSLPFKSILEKVKEETTEYLACGVDGIIVENMHDVPYVRPPSSPELISSMTLACREVIERLGSRREEYLLGLQVLAACNQEAIAIAHCTNFDLVRVEGFVFGHVADEGYIDGCAGQLLRYRKTLGAEKVAVITDIKKKHSAHNITADVSIGETAKAAEFFLSDGIILTGSSTGQPASVSELSEIRKSTSLPIFIGSGVTADNVTMFSEADAFIVGSEFKVGGDWKNALDSRRIRKFMNVVKSLQH